MPSIALKEDVGVPGHYYGQVVVSGTMPNPAVELTNVASVPPVTVPVVPKAFLSATAMYSYITKELTVACTTSDFASAVFVEVEQCLRACSGEMGDTGVPGVKSFRKSMPNEFQPPRTVRVKSSRGFTEVPVQVLSTNVPTAAGPTAVNDNFGSLKGSGSYRLDVTAANGLTADVISTPTFTIYLTSLPTLGSATTVAGTGTVQYVPTPGASGPEAFEYIIVDANGKVSKVAKVSLNLVFGG